MAIRPLRLTCCWRPRKSGGPPPFELSFCVHRVLKVPNGTAGINRGRPCDSADRTELTGPANQTRASDSLRPGNRPISRVVVIAAG